MFSIDQPPLQMCDGVARRELMRIGGLSALGLSLPTLLKNQKVQAEKPANTRPQGSAKSVILIFLLGGQPQHETWDPKPDAPDTIRGEGRTIASAIPGFPVGEGMPQIAKLVDQMAVLRAVVSEDNAHSSSGYQMLTGVPHVPLNRENATPTLANSAPSMASIIRYLSPDQHGLPSSIVLPRHIANDGEIVWPGQRGGYLGQKYDPWVLTCDPSEENFQVPSLKLPAEMSKDRLGHRLSLLEQLDERFRTLDHRPSVNQFSDHYQQALNLVGSSESRTAFDLNRESASTRERYGKTRFGQSLLLSRRLVEAGVPLIQVNWTRIDKVDNNGTWDTHANHFKSLKDHLMPRLDQSFSALMNDLRERGLLEDTLVALMSEFGHTPKINGRAGRDHWGRVFSVAFAGGGIKGGAIHGSSDAHGAFPVSGRVEPRDITATILNALGFPPDTHMQDNLGRPLPISRGDVITQLF